MKNIKKIIIICLMFIFISLVSCKKDSHDETDEYGSDEHGIYTSVEYMIHCTKLDFLSTDITRDINKVYFDTKDYNYYGDFQIYLDDEVIFDSKDYNYFIPANKMISVEVEYDRNKDHSFYSVVGDGFIKTASTAENTIGSFGGYEAGVVDVIFGFDNHVDMFSDIELVEGNSKFVFKGYHGYLDINNENVETSISIYIPRDDYEEYYYDVIFDVKATKACVIHEGEITYNHTASVITVSANNNQDVINVQSNVILANSDQSMTYYIYDAPYSNSDIYVEYDTNIRISITNFNGTYNAGLSNGKTLLVIHWGKTRQIEIVMTAATRTSPDILVYKK